MRATYLTADELRQAVRQLDGYELHRRTLARLRDERAAIVSEMRALDAMLGAVE